ncbi:MAG TPA: glycoside hydrolase family 3 N-terminal domain-containing protein, partial [Rhodanobacter sp.]|nr:glycoside hydrolase family 3 N-terminal domain-containing protein [Rhodanobacter sp.]
MFRFRWLWLACAALAASGGETWARAATPSATDTRGPAATHYTDWPAIKSELPADPALAARARRIVAGMTLAQKIGQMTQAEIKTATPEDVRKYYLGSVLNGGGSWPGGDKHASIHDWLNLADAYYAASMATGLPTPIPVIWGTDAVHGDSNVYGATLFPHNIGLGAAHDPALVRAIGAATAKAVRATGVQWAFAPTVAVAQDARWGRTYESFSSAGPLVGEYAQAYVEGLQGDFGDHDVIATAKHFIGDGSTWQGKDQGQSRVSREAMINVHGAGYYGALRAGAQSVMISYNSWDDLGQHVDYGKISGAQALVTGVLKDRLGFGGLVVSDWNAIGQLPGCSNADCPLAVNAGIDLFMVPDDWKAFIANTMREVQEGKIPLARIDDAATRIIEVKLRMGLFDGKRPSQRAGAGDAALLEDRDLARRAVRESLVLLKNDHAVLPLKAGAKILVVGKGADSLSNQAGGWSLTWQGTDNTNADFPHATSILAGLREADGAGNVSYREDARGVDAAKFDAIVAVIGEKPYAEMMGDIPASATLRHTDRYPEDLAVLDAVAKAHKPVVTVFLSGRPLFVNDLLNRSDAFVAAWLPGSEGAGVADVLFARKLGAARANFRGTLSMPWPAVPCPDAPDAGAAAWLFPVGYGLRYGQPHELGRLPTEASVTSCGAVATVGVFHTLAVPPFSLYLEAAGQAPHELGPDLNGVTEWPAVHSALRVATVQVNTQQDAKSVTWLAPARFLARSAAPRDLSAAAKAGAAMQFDTVVAQPPQGAATLFVGCGARCRGGVDLGRLVAGFAPGSRHTVTVPLSCFARAGADLSKVDVPFGVAAAAPFSAAFADVKLVMADAAAN